MVLHFVLESGAATGIHNLQTLPRTDILAAIHCESTDIDDIRVTVDNVEVFDLTDEQIVQTLNNIPDITPQAGWTHVMFNASGRHEDNLPMVYPVGKNRIQRVQSFQVDFNMSAATSFDILVESIGAVI